MQPSLFHTKDNEPHRVQGFQIQQSQKNQLDILDQFFLRPNTHASLLPLIQPDGPVHPCHSDPLGLFLDGDDLLFSNGLVPLAQRIIPL